MHIKKASELTGVSIRSLRYYESKKLLTPERLSNGYRFYSNKDIERISTIKLYLSLGLRVSEIYKFLACEGFEDRDQECTNSSIDFYEMKLEILRREIASLKSKESRLISKIESLSSAH